MKIKNDIKRFILEWLGSKQNDLSFQVIDELLIKGASNQFKDNEIVEQLVAMDNRHEQLLQVIYIPVQDGLDVIEGLESVSGWLSEKGWYWLKRP